MPIPGNTTRFCAMTNRTYNSSVSQAPHPLTPAHYVSTWPLTSHPAYQPANDLVHIYHHYTAPCCICTVCSLSQSMVSARDSQAVQQNFCYNITSTN